MQKDNFDFLIKQMTDDLTKSYVENFANRSGIINEVDTSALLNLTLSVFISSLSTVLNLIKRNTHGESKLIKNIELTQKSLVKAIEDFPWMNKVTYI